MASCEAQSSRRSYRDRARRPRGVTRPSETAGLSRGRRDRWGFEGGTSAIAFVALRSSASAMPRQRSVAEAIVGVDACAMTEAVVGSSFASAASQVSLLRSSPYPHEAHGNLDLPVSARRRVKPSS